MTFDITNFAQNNDKTKIYDISIDTVLYNYILQRIR